MEKLILNLLRKDPLTKTLDHSTMMSLAKSEAQVQKIENKYNALLETAFEKISNNTLQELALGNSPDTDAIGEIFADNFFETSYKSLVSAKSEWEISKNRRMAMWVPKSYRDLMKAYDHYRKTGKLPKRQQTLYERIKADYLKQCRKVWDKYGEKFRTGETASRVEATQQIRKAAETTTSRAQTIVRTETTSAYNQVKKEYFDSSPDVTHYMLIAIRDKRTTHWCSSTKFQGLRGRHGLVYAKDDPLCDKEVPACHWNCRSSWAPLSPRNPTHLKFINDKSLARRNNQCYPLPKGWRS